MVHSGSWLGLPDFGITEAVGKVFNRPTTSQGGSNLVGPNPTTQSYTPNPVSYYTPPQYSTGGSVLGSNTYTGSNLASTNQQPTQQPTQQPQQQQQGGGGDPYAQVRNDINSGYNNYFSQLDQMYGGLDSQANAQNQIVQNSYQQGANTLGSQLATGKQDLNSTRQKTESAQAKTLTDLAESMRNQFMTGQVMLGSKGAGDSSAANQYAYALTKMGNKQRGDVTSQTASIQNDINDREFKLQNTYNTELQNLQLERDSKIQGISQWLAEAQNQIRQMRASGELSKGQDLASLSQNALNYALQQVQQAQAEVANRRSMLEQWAIQKSTDINSLKQNMASISTMSPNLPAFQGLNGTPNVAQQQANPYLFGMGSSDEKNLLNFRV